MDEIDRPAPEVFFYHDPVAAERRRRSAGRARAMEGFLRMYSKLRVHVLDAPLRLDPNAAALAPDRSTPQRPTPWSQLLSAARVGRVRRPSTRTVEKQVGRPITSVTDHRDGSRTHTFGQEAKEAQGDDEVEAWIAKQKARAHAR